MNLGTDHIDVDPKTGISEVLKIQPMGVAFPEERAVVVLGVGAETLDVATFHMRRKLEQWRLSGWFLYGEADTSTCDDGKEWIFQTVYTGKVAHA